MDLMAAASHRRVFFHPFCTRVHVFAMVHSQQMGGISMVFIIIVFVTASSNVHLDWSLELSGGDVSLSMS